MRCGPSGRSAARRTSKGNYKEEPTENVGTCPRSACRLTAALPGTVAVAVSQDGDIRFVTAWGDALTYWDYA